MRESIFERNLRAELESRFPGCLYIKQDSSLLQGIPDRLVLWRDKWAALEVKRSKTAPHRPNQEYYVELMGGMSFAAFIYPENMETVLDDLERSFKA